MLHRSSSRTALPSISSKLGSNIHASALSQKLRCSFHLAAFNIRMLAQIGQQAGLARILETFKINVCRVSGTDIRDFYSVITPCSSDATSFLRFTLLMSSDPVASARGQAGFGIVLGMRVERPLVMSHRASHLMQFSTTSC